MDRWIGRILLSIGLGIIIQQWLEKNTIFSQSPHLDIYQYIHQYCMNIEDMHHPLIASDIHVSLGGEPKLLKQGIIIYGNWCGPNWTGRKYKSWVELSPLEKHSLAPPVDHTDRCCQIHDIRFAECIHQFPCHRDQREACMKEANLRLSRCIKPSGFSRQGIIKWFMSFHDPDPEENCKILCP